MPDKQSTLRPYPPFGLIQIKLTDPSNPVQSPFNCGSAANIVVNCERITMSRLDFYATDLESFKIEFFSKDNLKHPFRLGEFGDHVDGKLNCFQSACFTIGKLDAQRLQVVANQGRRENPPSICYKIYPTAKPGTVIPDQIIDPDCCMEC